MIRDAHNHRSPRSARRPQLILAALAVLATTLVLGVTLAAAVAPTVTVEDASSVSYTSAHVAGEVDPQGQSTTYRFQYVTDTHFQENVTNSLPGFEGASTGPEATIEGAAQPVEGELTGLAPGTTYHLRLVAENADGPSEAVAASTFPTLAVAAPTVAIDPVTTFTGTTAHFSGTINPNAPGGNPAAFNVNWRFQCSPDCPGLSGTIPADNSSHTVEADATGLLPGTAYEVTLVAENTSGPFNAGPESFGTPAIAPEIKGVRVHSRASEAEFRLTISPGGALTTYRIDYGRTAAYGQTSAEAAIPAGSSDAEVSVVLLKLTPGVGYHFRVSTENSAGADQGPDEAFTTRESAPTDSCANAVIRSQQHSSYLADCRAYEMVSPLQKNLFDVGVAPGGTLAASSGSGVVFHSYGAFPGAQYGNTQPYIGRRDPVLGWSTQAVIPVMSKPGGKALSGAKGFSTDLSQMVIGVPDGISPLLPGATPNSYNLYRQSTLGGARELIAPFGIPLLGSTSQTELPSLTAASEDFDHIAFQSSSQQTPDAPAGARMNLYEWSDGEVSLAGRVPASGVECDDVSGPPCVPAPGSWSGADISLLPGSTSDFGVYTNTVMSSDGSRLFFNADPEGGLYLREGSRTVKVSASQAGTPDPSGPFSATFQGATPDGSRVLFTSCEKLTDDSTASGFGTPCDGSELSGENAGRRTDLYLYEVATGALHDLSASAEFSSAGMLGVLGMSDSGGRVYFAAQADLAPGAVLGKANIYLWERGADTRLLATMPLPSDFLNGGVIGTACNWATNSNGCGAPKVSRVTPDGRFALLATSVQLTDESTGGAMQLYRFDAEAGAEPLDCVSCGKLDAGVASGFEPGGPKGAGGNLRPFLRHSLSDDGRVAFDSRDALLPQDVNGRSDIYLWSEQGLSLLSTGRGNADAYFADASPNFNDIFLTTREGLVGVDRDHNVDLYDARAGGGFEEPTIQAPCVGASCKNAPPPPGGAAPASSNLLGPGNAEPRRPKGRLAKRCTRAGKPTKAKRSKCAKGKTRKNRNASSNRRPGR